MSDTENKKGLIEVIENLMEKNLQEKDMAVKDTIKNPQDDSKKEEVKEEGQDTKIEKGVNDKELPDAEKETLANKQAAAPTAEPDKEVSGAEDMKDSGGEKGTGGGSETAEVEADKPSHDQESDPIETPMKDESDPKKKVSETKDEPKEMADKEQEETKDEDEVKETKEKDEELKGDQKKLDKDGDGDIGADDLAKVRAAKEDVSETKEEEETKEEDEVKEMKKDDMEELTDKQKELPAGLQKAIKDKEDKKETKEVEEEKQDTSVEKDANDKQLPTQDKETLDMSKGDNDSPKAEADLAPHKQESDPIETPMKDDSDPKDKVKETKDEDPKEEEDKVEEMKKDTEEEKEDEVSEMKDMEKEEDEKKATKEVEEMSKETKEMKDMEKEEDEKDMEEDVDLDEDFKQKAAIVFETAVNEKVNAKVAEIKEQMEAEAADHNSELEEKFSKYTDYATEEWLKENALEIKYSLRTEIAENFIKDLKGLFEKNYIDIPEDDIKVVDELTEAVESYKDQISEKDGIVEELQSKVLAFEKEAITNEVSDGLTETQKIRLEKLSESVEAGNTEEFKEKLETLKESYFENPETAAKALSSYGDEVFSNSESEISETDAGGKHPVSQYVRYLSKTALK